MFSNLLFKFYFFFVVFIVCKCFVNGGVLTITVNKENDIQKPAFLPEDLQENKVSKSYTLIV